MFKNYNGLVFSDSIFVQRFQKSVSLSMRVLFKAAVSYVNCASDEMRGNHKYRVGKDLEGGDFSLIV